MSRGRVALGGHLTWSARGRQCGAFVFRECVLPRGVLGAVLPTVSAPGGVAVGPGLSRCPQGGVVLVPLVTGHCVSFPSEQYHFEVRGKRIQLA